MGFELEPRVAVVQYQQVRCGAYCCGSRTHCSLAIVNRERDA